MWRGRMGMVLAAPGLVALGLACSVFEGAQTEAVGQQPPAASPTGAAVAATAPERPANRHLPSLNLTADHGPYIM